MNRELTYQTIRDEILDQKKCQFQMFSVSVTVTAAIIAFAGSAGAGRVIYVAPIILNALAQWLVIDKAISIQRKVGYLQLMEEKPEEEDWRWESDLDEFRSDKGQSDRGEKARNHTFATMIWSLLMTLSVFCAALYFSRIDSTHSGYMFKFSYRDWMDYFCVFILLAPAAGVWWLRHSVVFGNNSTSAVRKKWHRVLAKRLQGDMGAA